MRYHLSSSVRDIHSTDRALRLPAERGSKALLKAQIEAGRVFPAEMTRWQAKHGVWGFAA